ncbi:MAG TPA: amidase family protein [Caulobacteraceae bacterium]|jgi:amidase
MDVLAQDATGQLSALAAGDTTAVALLGASVARADAIAGRINAVVARDLGRAVDDARRIDERRARGEQLGRLAGLPMTIKDILDVEGLPASAGIAGETNRTATDAVVVARARAEGAVIWGKTNVPVRGSDHQTYNPVYGVTNNPWDVTRTPGGSSGGAAAAVAAGVTALEIGSDIGGSLRTPASFCGVFAHKPTFGLVPQLGHWPPDQAADVDMGVIGPLARSARDLSLLLAIIAGTPPSDHLPLQLKEVRIALWLDEPTFALDGDARTPLEAFAAKLAAAGAVVEPIGSPVDADLLVRTYTLLLYPIVTAEAGFAERALYEVLRTPAKLVRALGAGPLSPAQAILAASARHRDWLRADNARKQLRRAAEAVFETYDVILAPSAPVPPFKHDHRPLHRRSLRLSDGRKRPYTEPLAWHALASVCGLPSTAIPAGLSAAGLPIGAQLIGPHGADFDVLAIAEAIDRELGGLFVAPPLAS